MNYAFRYTLDFLARVIIIITTLAVLATYTNISFPLSLVILLILLYWAFLPLRGLAEEIERGKANDKKKK
jgi:hypothetical protein